MKIVEFQCLKCGRVQEKWLKRLSSKNTENCEHCQSPPDQLRRCLCYPKHHQHISWSKWRV